MADKFDFIKYEKVRLALDNGQAGDEATRHLLERHKNMKDLGGDFAGYKDYNEKLQSIK